MAVCVFGVRLAHKTMQKVKNAFKTRHLKADLQEMSLYFVVGTSWLPSPHMGSLEGLRRVSCTLYYDLPIIICRYEVLYMLGPKNAPAPCWNWDRIFAPCWNWDADSPVVAPCHNGVPHAGTGTKNEIVTYPVLELGALCWNWTPRAETGVSSRIPKFALARLWHQSHHGVPQTSTSASLGRPDLSLMRVHKYVV